MAIARGLLCIISLCCPVLFPLLLLFDHYAWNKGMFYVMSDMSDAGSNREGVQGAHLNPLGLFLKPLGLFLRTSIPVIWRILSAFLRARTPWLRGPVSPRCRRGVQQDPGRHLRRIQTRAVLPFSTGVHRLPLLPKCSGAHVSRNQDGATRDDSNTEPPSF